MPYRHSLTSPRRGRRLALGVVALAIAGSATASFLAAPPSQAAADAGAGGFKLPDRVTFNRDIRPIFSDTCFRCHGVDPHAREADLRMDLRADAIADHDGITPLVPGKPLESEAFRRMTTTKRADLMPPPKLGKPLSPRQIALVKKWIEQGAEYEAHWAFIPPLRPAAPKVAGKAVNAVDAFVLRKLAAEGFEPSPEAERRTLIRRVSLDLTGLPPTPAQVDAFVADTSADAYEKVVDRLLASPRYGEHMARFWLDAARYADTNGYQYDLEREQWVWRDWVIAAFNSNKPFDRFTIEQMAGDLLPAAEATDQTRLATAFHRNHPITIEGGVIDEEYRTEYVMDRVVVTSTTWMGLTFLCARCHSHKYDPITQEEFYSFYAFFNNVSERGLNGFDPKAKIASPLSGEGKQGLDERIAELERQFAAATAGGEPLYAAWEKTLGEQLGGEWRIAKPTAAEADGGTKLVAQPDGSYLATGPNPATQTFTFTLDAGDQPVRGIRVEAMTHESHVNRSTGRGSNGNFVLTETTVEVGDGNTFRPVTLVTAEADYEQSGYPAAHTIDGTKTGRAGWAVDGNTRFESSTIAYTFAEPIDAGTVIRVKLIHDWGGSHTIGRPRVSAAHVQPTPLVVRNILSVEPAKRTPQQTQTLRAHLVRRYGGQEAIAIADQLEAARAQQAAKTGEVPATMIMVEMPKPRQAYVLDRGEYDRPLKDKPVSPSVPAALGKLPDGAPANRLGLAMWMVARDNPLTARVTVNRLWAQLFGVGLVKTVEDFGSQGDYPSHPDLLDWLAVEFMDSGWDVKHIMKTMALSATYRQSSHVSDRAAAEDPENRLLSHGPRFRLDAETVRDSALAVSGLMVQKLGGPSVFPYHPPGLWEEINNRPGLSRVYKVGSGDDLYRRSLYSFWKRTVPPPSMATFDAPEREYCVVRRSRTNTPLQAFVMLHDPQYVEAAWKLGERMMKEGGDSVESRLAYGFALCTGRPPSPAEFAVLRKTYDDRLAQYKSDPDAAGRVLAIGESPRDQSLDQAELAAYAVVGRLLLNLSEFVTKG